MGKIKGLGGNGKKKRLDNSAQVSGNHTFLWKFLYFKIAINR